MSWPVMVVIANKVTGHVWFCRQVVTGVYEDVSVMVEQQDKFIETAGGVWRYEELSNIDESSVSDYHVIEVPRLRSINEMMSRYVKLSEIETFEMLPTFKEFNVVLKSGQRKRLLLESSFVNSDLFTNIKLTTNHTVQYLVGEYDGDKYHGLTVLTGNDREFVVLFEPLIYEGHTVEYLIVHNGKWLGWDGWLWIDLDIDPKSTYGIDGDTVEGYLTLYRDLRSTYLDPIVRFKSVYYIPKPDLDDSLIKTVNGHLHVSVLKFFEMIIRDEVEELKHLLSEGVANLKIKAIEEYADSIGLRIDEIAASEKH